MGWQDRLLNKKPGTVGRAFSKGPHGHGSMPQLSTYNRGGRILSQQDLGRGGMNKGGRVGLKEGTDYESEKESKLYKKSLQQGDAKVAEKVAAKDRIEAKKKRDKSQAQHVSPGGGGREKPGPHKIDYNRRDLKPLLKWMPEKAQEGVLKFADKFDKKQKAKGDKKRAKKKMQDRAKKLTAYEGTT